MSVGRFEPRHPTPEAFRLLAHRLPAQRATVGHRIHSVLPAERVASPSRLIMNTVEHERRVATWAPAPGRPQNSLSRRLLDNYRTAWPLFAFPLLYVVGATIGRLADTGFLSRSFPWVMGGLVVALGAHKLWEFVRSRRPAAAKEFADITPRLTVTMQLYVVKFIYGEDRGEIALVEDWMIFEGERTCFSLGPHDVAYPREREKMRGCPVVAMTLRDLPADVHLVLITNDPHRSAQGFLSIWASGRVRHPSTSVLPPMEPMAGWKVTGGYSNSASDRVARHLSAFVPILYLPFAVAYYVFAPMSLGLRILAVLGVSIAFLAPYLWWHWVARRQALASLERARRGLKAFDTPNEELLEIRLGRLALAESPGDSIRNIPLQAERVAQRDEGTPDRLT